MRCPRRRRHRALARLRPLDRLASSRDNALLAFAGEFEANDCTLHDLLARDGRDAGDVPGFDEVADRQAELIALIVATPARSLAGTLAKARCARLRPPELGFDAALGLALSASDDLIRLAGARPSRTFGPPPGPSRAAAVGTGEGSGGSQMPGPPDVALRPTILRRGDVWRHLGDALAQVGVWSLAGATVLPLDGVHLRWAVAAALLAVGGSATFVVSRLRRTDRPG